jgi:hypothetical protein
MNLCKTKLKRTQYIYDNTKEPYVNPIVPHERTIIGKEKIWTSEPFALIQMSATIDVFTKQNKIQKYH